MGKILFLFADETQTTKKFTKEFIPSSLQNLNLYNLTSVCLIPLSVFYTFPMVPTGIICFINNQELHKLAIISFILETLISDSGMILQKEIGC